MSDPETLHWQLWLIALLKILTGSTLSGRVCNIISKVVFSIALVWHDVLLQKTIKAATRLMTPTFLREETRPESSCPVFDDTNTTILVYGFTTPSGSHSGGNGIFWGATYSLPQWELYIKWPLFTLCSLIIIRLLGWPYLNPLFPRTRDAEQHQGFHRAVFVFVFFVHVLTEFAFGFLVYHAIKNIMGYETPKALWKEPPVHVWLNEASNQHLAVASRQPDAPPGNLPFHIFALMCQKNNVVGVLFWNHLQYHSKDAADRMQILRDEQSYHTGWRLRLAMYVSSATVVLSIVVGVLSQALDFSSDWKEVPQQYVASRRGSPMNSPRQHYSEPVFAVEFGDLSETGVFEQPVPVLRGRPRRAAAAH